MYSQRDKIFYYLYKVCSSITKTFEKIRLTIRLRVAVNKIQIKLLAKIGLHYNKKIISVFIVENLPGAMDDNDG